MSLFGASPPAGTLQLLGSGTAASVTSSGFDFTGLISSRYDDYILKLYGTGDTSNDNIELRLSNDNGATFIATGYTYANTRHLANGAIGDDESTSATSIPLIIAAADNDTYVSKGVDLTISFNRCGDTSLYPVVSWQGGFSNNNTPCYFTSVQGHGSGWGLTSMNAFQLLSQTGTFTLRWSFFGLAK